RDTFKRCLEKAFEGDGIELCEIVVQVGERTLWFSVEANIGVTGTDCLTAMFDITDRKKAEKTQKIADEEKEKRANELALAASVFAHAGEAITITDAAGTILDVNNTFSKTTGYSRDEVIGKNARILQSDRQSPEFYIDMWQVLLQKGYWYGEMWSRRKSGELYAEMKTMTAVRDVNDVITHYVSLCTDITVIKEHQEQLEHMVNYDILTHLPNRSLLADRLSQAMLQCNRNDQSLAVLFLDLDGFKSINDAYGHDVGDELLIALSRRMQEAFREGDTLARIGGDEFVAILTNLEKFEDCEPILERILLAVSGPVELGGAILNVSASIGVTLYPQDRVDTDQLVRHADQAMYVAKGSGKNRYHLFDTAQDDAVKERRKNLAAIRVALDDRQFVLYYQPKVNMRTGRVTGVEALIRWQHPERGLLNPIEFLPVIENHAYNIEMGEWVIDTALTQISQWQAIGLNLSIVISINISAVQLQQPKFADKLAILLAAHPDVDPHYLELEVLETSILNDVQNVSEIMNACISLGVNFALDDFGTGYSSLTHLRRLPARVIKIDQSFIRDMLVDVDDLAIVEGVIGLAKSFKREVIAEGVETIEHGAALLRLGCELAQGRGIARPMPASDILPWINNWKPDVSW
ncbi:MAG: EAL domain-containing protein, partial [Marinobacter sp.]